MRQITGVASVVPDEGYLKSKLLLFDKIVVLAGGFPDPETGHLRITDEWEYLESRGVLFHPEAGDSPVGKLNVTGDLRERTYDKRPYLDYMARITANLYGSDHIPICRRPITESFVWPDDAPPKSLEQAVRISLLDFPTPNEGCAWEDILDFKEELRDKLWGFRRFLSDLATKKQSDSEVRDDIEWTMNEYRKAMELHHLKASQSFFDVFIIPPIELIENIAKLNLSRVAKGILSAQKRNIELLEAEMKAPGRECAYVFEAQKRFQDK